MSEPKDDTTVPSVHDIVLPSRIELEVFDCDVIEGVGVTYEQCFFFDCRFIGKDNTFRGCTFQNTFNQPVLMCRGNSYIECMFDVIGR